MSELARVAEVHAGSPRRPSFRRATRPARPCELRRCRWPLLAVPRVVGPGDGRGPLHRAPKGAPGGHVRMADHRTCRPLEGRSDAIPTIAKGLHPRHPYTGSDIASKGWHRCIQRVAWTPSKGCTHATRTSTTFRTAARRFQRHRACHRNGQWRTDRHSRSQALREGTGALRPRDDRGTPGHRAMHQVSRALEATRPSRRGVLDMPLAGAMPSPSKFCRAGGISGMRLRILRIPWPERHDNDHKHCLRKSSACRHAQERTDSGPLYRIRVLSSEPFAPFDATESATGWLR